MVPLRHFYFITRRSMIILTFRLQSIHYIEWMDEGLLSLNVFARFLLPLKIKTGDQH
jgi:hypothetical protein